MTDWREPPEQTTEDTAPLLAKLERVEGLALRVVEDEMEDAGFGLIGLIVGWIAVLHRRVVSAERWNRRAERKREMLGSEALRMNMVDRLGGVEALDRWEERARLALSFSSQADGSRLRGNDEGGGFGRGNSETSAKPTHTTQHPHTPQHTPSSPRRRGSPSGSPEFALARMPGRGVRRATTCTVRAAPRHETPIPVWPCEVMPERFERTWWKAELSDADRPTGDVVRHEAVRNSTIKRHSADAGGPGLNPGTFVL